MVIWLFYFSLNLYMYSYLKNQEEQSWTITKLLMKLKNIIGTFTTLSWSLEYFSKAAKHWSLRETLHY